MHLLRLSIALGLVAICANAAVIYKWTDADGVVHYSDQAVPGAEKIVTSSNSSNGIGGGTHAPAAVAGRNAPPPSRVEYTGFTIESPAKDQVFFGDEIIPVRLRLEPDLKPDQTITWYLNGAPLTDQPPTSRSFTLQSLPRGTHQISATIMDTVTGESQSSEGVTFYVRQPSELSPQHRKP